MEFKFNHDDKVVLYQMPGKVCTIYNRAIVDGIPCYSFVDEDGVPYPNYPEDSLEAYDEDSQDVLVDSWILKEIADTLRLCWNNIEHNTCLGRNINQSRILIRKLLNNEEITGMERLEKYE